VQQVKGLSGDAEQQEQNRLQKALVEKETERSSVPDHNALEETVEEEEEEEEHQTSEPHVSEVTCTKPAFEVVVSSQERAKRCMRTVVPKKENLYPESDEPENRRLREQIHRLRQQLVNLRRKYTGSRNQYCALQQRFCGKAPFTFAADSSGPVDNSHTNRKPLKETLAADPQRNGLDAQECGANAAKRKRMSGIPPANDASDQGGVILPEVEATVPKQRPSLAVGSDFSARLVSGSSSKELLQPVAAKSGKPEIAHISTEVCKGRPDCRSTTTENGRSECEEEQLVKKPEQVSMRHKNSGNSHYKQFFAIRLQQA
jgi:hypothetical protein